MTWYDALLFCMESARSIGHKSDTLTTHISIDQNNHSYYKTSLESLCRFLILFDILYIKVSLKQNSYFLLRDKLLPGTNLRKPGLVPGESLSLSKKYEFCFRETLIYKFRKILLLVFAKWEDLFDEHT